LTALHAVLHQTRVALAALGEVETALEAGPDVAPALAIEPSASDGPDRAVTPEEIATADAVWAAARARGPRYREVVRAATGPLLTPRQVADRLGISVASVNNWRRQGRLLALQLDRHQYLYPAVQFVDDPARGEGGVVRGLDRVLAALGEQTGWARVLFLTSPAPALGGRRPLDLLLAGEPGAVERVCRLAARAFEMGVA
jgi:hypothetical protein